MTAVDCPCLSCVVSDTAYHHQLVPIDRRGHFSRATSLCGLLGWLEARQCTALGRIHQPISVYRTDGGFKSLVICQILPTSLEKALFCSLIMFCVCMYLLYMYIFWEVKLLNGEVWLLRNLLKFWDESVRFISKWNSYVTRDSHISQLFLEC